MTHPCATMLVQMNHPKYQTHNVTYKAQIPITGLVAICRIAPEASAATLCSQILEIQAPGPRRVLRHHRFNSWVLSLWSFLDTVSNRHQLMPLFFCMEATACSSLLWWGLEWLLRPRGVALTGSSRAVTGTEPEPKPLPRPQFTPMPSNPLHTHVLSAWNKPSSFRRLI